MVIKNLGLALSLVAAVAVAQPLNAFACEDAQRLLSEKEIVELKKVVVVGGYSSGSDLAPQLRAAGVQTIIHLHPAKEIPEALSHSFNAKDYTHDMVYNGKLAETIAELKRLGHIDAVLAGTETSVELTAHLNEALGLRGNPTQHIYALRKKASMQQRIKEAGLDSIRSLLSKDLNEILEWIDSPAGNNGQYPIIVKPNDGAGTQGVYTCYNREQVIAAVNSLKGTKNVLNLPVEAVLVQEYLKGEHETSEGRNKFLVADEYVVNMVSRGGKHVVGEIWRYYKMKVPRPDGGFSKIYLYDELLPLDGSLAKRMLPYAKKVLNALEITEGPSHMELMMTARGPVLIEVGARLMGGHTFDATRVAMGTSPLDLMIKNAVAPKEFEALAVDGAIKRQKYVRNVQLISKQEGTITRVNYSEAELKALLPSYFKSGMAGVGETLNPTVDLVTSPGNIWLISESQAALKRDYDIIRNIIEPTLFTVE